MGPFAGLGHSGSATTHRPRQGQERRQGRERPRRQGRQGQRPQGRQRLGQRRQRQRRQGRRIGREELTQTQPIAVFLPLGGLSKKKHTYHSRSSYRIGSHSCVPPCVTRPSGCRSKKGVCVCVCVRSLLARGSIQFQQLFFASHCDHLVGHQTDADQSSCHRSGIGEPPPHSTLAAHG